MEDNTTQVDNTAQVNESTDENQEEQKNYVFEVFSSANGLKAYLRVSFAEEDAVIDYNEVLAKLEEQKIVYGIKEDVIKEYCEKKEYYKDVIIAEGVAPTNGIDAYIDFKFKLDDALEFKEKEDGSVDFKNIDNIKSIAKDGVLCTMIPVVDGAKGINVFGQELDYQRGKEKQMPGGKNTHLSEDGMSLLASVDGAIHYNGKNIDIDNIYTVGDVDMTTGNIDFLGSVVIKGDVKDGFTVKAKDDIVVNGMVEGATLISEKNISISNGMNGRGVGKLICKGSVKSKFLENSNIEVEGSVYSDAIINCNVNAGKNIILKGNRGIIIGGVCKACNVISAKTIGTKNNIQTDIVVNLEKYLEDAKKREKEGSMQNIKKAISAKEKELLDINNKIEYLKPYAKKSPDNEKLYKLLILKRMEVNKEMVNFKAKMIETDSNNQKIIDHKVICSGVIFANTRIEIGWLKYIVRDDISYSKIYNDGSEIKVSQLLPSDIGVEEE